MKAFTEQEQKVMNKILDAHNEFQKLIPSHNSEMQDWVFGIHQCQGILLQRVARRDHLGEFRTTPEFEEECKKINP